VIGDGAVTMAPNWSRIGPTDRASNTER